jgi:hypothetical protein
MNGVARLARGRLSARRRIYRTIPHDRASEGIRSETRGRPKRDEP